MAGKPQLPTLADGSLDISNIQFRTACPTDIAECREIEKASYPSDEAASKNDLQYRQHHAAPYFQCAYLEISSGNDSSDTSEDQQYLVGFICSTRCHVFEKETMSTHQSDGPLLAIHSVVVRSEFRRQGLASNMLKFYLESVKRQISSMPMEHAIHKLVLLSKKHLLSFYVDCGFSVLGVSPITHGLQPWYHLELNVDDTSASSILVDPVVVSPEGRECYVVDSFAASSTPGTGNPAAVVILPSDTDSVKLRAWMQIVAAEFNLSETAFCWPREQAQASSSACEQQNTNNRDLHWNIRYFSPKVEVPLCGHATLASAAILFQTRKPALDRKIVFHASENELTMELAKTRTTLSTLLNNNTIVNEEEEEKGLPTNMDPHPIPQEESSASVLATKISMEFPAKPARELQTREDQVVVRNMLESAFLCPLDTLFLGISDIGDVLVELTPASFRDIGYDIEKLNIKALLEWDGYYRGVIVCCRCDNKKKVVETNTTKETTNGAPVVPAASQLQPDFLSRFFGPKAGIDEDPVTGSAHCVLGPYFSAKLGKEMVIGKQTSERGGIVECWVSPEKVILTGTAVTTMSGTLYL